MSVYTGPLRLLLGGDKERALEYVRVARTMVAFANVRKELSGGSVDTIVREHKAGTASIRVAIHKDAVPIARIYVPLVARPRPNRPIPVLYTETAYESRIYSAVTVGAVEHKYYSLVTVEADELTELLGEDIPRTFVEYTSLQDTTNRAVGSSYIQLDVVYIQFTGTAMVLRPRHTGEIQDEGS